MKGGGVKGFIQSPKNRNEYFLKCSSKSLACQRLSRAKHNWHIERAISMAGSRDRLAPWGERPPSNPVIQVWFSRWVFLLRWPKNAQHRFIQIILWQTKILEKQLISTLSSSKRERSLKKLVLWHHTTLQSNSTTTTSPAYTLNLRQSSSDGCNWVR